jgi:ribonucleoside-diphosphate reductase alpha chain
MPILKVRKRDGSLQDFSQKKITDAIHKAILAARKKDGKLAEVLSNRVVEILEQKFPRKIPSVEDIQDVVIEVLGRTSKKLAKEYKDYREKKAELRKLRKKFGIDVKLTVNALEVLRRRYLLKGEKGEIIENPYQLFKRVVKSISRNKKMEKVFYRMLSNLEFLPNTPTLMNAGTNLGQLSACFVLPIEDSLKSIFDTLELTAKVHQSGGGTGFSFSRLRPEGDIVKSTKGVASGPVTFMTIYDKETDVIKQGGKRRGANMGILRVDHPDILKFITAKNDSKILSNFNVSVAITDKFMKAVFKNKNYNLINPRNNKVVGKLNARKVFDLIVENAWREGDPGMIFIDEINRKNPTKNIGLIESTNPCGEQPLHPYESCNLGSINLSRIVKGKGIDWKELKDIVRNAVVFLDSVIDINHYPDPRIEKMTRSNRRIGLGVMGFAELLIKLNMKYDSKEAVRLGERVMRFIEREGHKMSQELGKKKGNFPNFKGSLWQKRGYRHMRNATVTTIAPTGTISIIAGCSSGIEPLFAVSFIRNVMEGTKLFEVNPLFERIAKERGFYSAKLLEEVARTGSIQKIRGIPNDIKRIFRTALDISPEWHVRMQAAFQKYTDSAVSKTINLPNNAKISDVRKAYLLAYKLKCKGITVFRYGSKPQQVLYFAKEKPLQAESEYAGGCPFPSCPY